MNTFWESNSSKSSQNKIKKLAEVVGMDAKALNILFNANWDYDSGGWISSRNREKDMPAEDFDYGKAQGLLRADEEVTIQELFKRIQTVVKGLDKEKVSNAFIKGVVTQNPALISVLGSYSYYLSIDEHYADTYVEYAKKYENKNTEKILIDYNDNVFLRLFRSGLMSHQDPVYAYVDLLDFSQIKSISITETDIEFFSSMLDAIRHVPSDLQSSGLDKVVQPFLKGNKLSREIVLRILGLSDILNPSINKRIRYNYALNHELPSHFYKKEVGYPLAWWEGKYGLDEDAVTFWFGHL